ncbi:uncharacterized protein LOC134252833 [Saccostrea cucullata]|uniref:uncharacterized protein LOC134252833 n=1 Tax=Saccostrea cuccullata TaxID=36930 RepID=UPI002ED03BA7
MGDNPFIKQMNTDGKLLDKIPTMSGTDLYDLAVTKEGYLVYIDNLSKYINIMMKRGEIGCPIFLQEWTPLALCSSSTEGLLVAMKSSNSGQSKVVRYVDSTATQDIQNNSEGKALYSTPFCIEENKNFDIIVSDYDVGKVVIVDKNGRFRFSYDGNLQSKSYAKFTPRTLATNRMCHILIADQINRVIHIIDQDGKFLFIISNCKLQAPFYLSTDNSDNLLVAEGHYGIVKIIKL